MRGTRKTIWHKASEVPQDGKYVLYRQEVTDDISIGETHVEYDTALTFKSEHSNEEWEEFCEATELDEWCYISDIENL